MSLTLFTDMSKISVPFVRVNDRYFNGVFLRDDEIVRTILSKIDDCDYCGERSVFSRKHRTILLKDALSTRCKTLLNIYLNPDVCFDMSECGYNTFNLLAKIHEGYAYLKYPVFAVFTEEEDICDIILDGKHFNRLTGIIDYAINGVDVDV